MSILQEGGTRFFVWKEQGESEDKKICGQADAVKCAFIFNEWDNF